MAKDGKRSHLSENFGVENRQVKMLIFQKKTTFSWVLDCREWKISVSESVKLSVSFSYFSSPSWRKISRHNTVFPPLKLVDKRYLFLAKSFLLFLVITNHFLGLFCTNASKLKGMGSSTEDTESCSSVDGCFGWPAEYLLGSCCQGPSNP